MRNLPKIFLRSFMHVTPDTYSSSINYILSVQVFRETDCNNCRMLLLLRGQSMGLKRWRNSTDLFLPFFPIPSLFLPPLSYPFPSSDAPPLPLEAVAWA